ncbi:MAG: amidohydrolase [Candidatus Aerophobus sp.]|nr:MAG: amidohydrolase [Candidatus Aerophobus sp.]
MVIDSHLHVLKQKNFDKTSFEILGHPFPEDNPIERLVDWLKGAGVKRAVIMGQDMTRIWNSSCGEEYVLECVRRYPDFFLALTSVEPVDTYGRFNKAALVYFEKTVRKNGFSGLLLTPPYGRFCSDDPAVYPFYEKAAELNVVVQFHHCAQLGPIALAPFKYADPVSLNNVLVDFPDLKVVVEHLNYPWYEELFFMMASDPNVYADIAMTYDRPNILTWNLVKAKEFGVIDRIMYASDYWVAGQGVFSENAGEDMKKWVSFIKTELNQIAEESGYPSFTQEEIDGILYKNAAGLYSLDL